MPSIDALVNTVSEFIELYRSKGNIINSHEFVLLSINVVTLTFGLVNIS